MSTPAAHRCFLTAALCLALLAPAAQAQESAEAPGPVPSVDIQRFVPVGSYHNFLGVHDGQLLPLPSLL